MSWVQLGYQACGVCALAFPLLFVVALYWLAGCPECNTYAEE